MPKIRLEKFRDLLAENGIEMTPEEAKDAYVATKKFIRVAKGLSLKDIWAVAEQNEDYARLYMKAKEI
jgi:hypothetical protein